MQRDKIIELAHLLGAREIVEGDRWITLDCPLAEYRHEGGIDKRPSFGIVADTVSAFHCFGCGVHGRLTVLPYILARYNHPATNEVRRFIFKYESWQPDKVKVETPEPQYMPDEILNRFSTFKRWGIINEESVKKWELRLDKETMSIIFPVRDRDGRLIGVRRRFRDGRKFEDRSLTPVPLKKLGIWYGIHLVDTNKPIYLVEGERDAILLHQVGVNAMASLGASVSRAQIETLNKLGAPVVCFFDNDEAGRRATSKIIRSVKVPASVVIYFGVKDPAEAVEKDIIGKFIRCG